MSQSSMLTEGQSVASAASATIRIASIPRGHVYVRHLDADHELPGYPRVERLADPDPAQPGRAAQSQWWPPAMLEAAWVRAHREFDIMHLQFGFDARSPEQLSEWADALVETGRPLVYTVHDLRNPHHDDPAEHDAQLDVLVPAADALITLTPGAAAEIRERWGREAHVLPHPHVVDFDTMARVAQVAQMPRTGRMERTDPRSRLSSRDAGEFRVGVHVKSLRANMDPMPVIRTLRSAVAELPGAVLQVNGHRDVLLEDGARFDPTLAAFLRRAASDGDIDLRIHDFFDDAQLWAYLGSLDVSVLPYRFGTHSGWLEACRDLGTAVAAPTCGYYAEQGEVFSYQHDVGGLDEASLVRAIRDAYDRGPIEPVSVASRRAQRVRVAQAHADIYRGLLA